MAEKRSITRDDVFLKARLLSEGVRFAVKRPPKIASPFRPVVLEGCGIVAMLRPGRYSRLDATIDGEEVVISEMGSVLGTGRLEPEPAWLDLPLSDGQPVRSVFSGSATIINVVLNFRCYNYDTGRGCRYCGLFASTSGSRGLPRSVARETTDRIVEGAAIAIQNGWRGTLVLTGGVLPPARRGQLTEDVERVMVQLRESLDSETLAELHIAPNSYPPEDFADMYKWRDLGVNSTEFDLEVMDPDYWRAICPGKSETHSQEHWKEAQVASVELFGRGRGATTTVVMGVEPMSGLLEGVEERISKGVYTLPNVFVPSPGSPYAEFRPPTADWLVEASEKMADIFFRYAGTLDVDLLADRRPGFTRIGRSFFLSLVGDELVRRLQEEGRFGPGLPKQDA